MFYRCVSNVKCWEHGGGWSRGASSLGLFILLYSKAVSFIHSKKKNTYHILGTIISQIPIIALTDYSSAFYCAPEMHLTLYTTVFDAHNTLTGRLLIIISILQIRKLSHRNVTCPSKREQGSEFRPDSRALALNHDTLLWQTRYSPCTRWSSA